MHRREWRPRLEVDCKTIDTQNFDRFQLTEQGDTALESLTGVPEGQDEYDTREESSPDRGAGECQLKRSV